MKQISILSGRCLVVELPEGATDPRVTHINGWNYSLTYDKSDALMGFDSVNLPFGDLWQLIGRLSKLRGDDIAGLIEPVKVFDYTAHYWNYNEEEYQPIMPEQSLESAILAAGFYFDNPYGKDEPVIDDPDPHSQYYGTQQDELARWQQAQSRVLDRSRCLLLGREI